MALLDWLQLALTDGIGPILIRRLIERTGGVEQAARATLHELQEVEGIGSAKATKIHRSLQAARGLAEAELSKAQRLGVRIICPDDGSYPPLLRQIPDPPSVLFVKGTIEPRDLNAIAIVGSRKCSFYGREQAERFAALLAGAGFTVISGGARGVDSHAHKGALQHGQGRTIAVLGCGVDRVYPPENEVLFEQITQHGAVVSEYPLGAPPLAENFPRRNRIVSGMSRGVLVVEADIKSGALITARQAADDHNRPVFALPGRIDNPLSAGPHMLIRDGAVLVTNLEQIVEALDPLPADVYMPERPAAAPASSRSTDVEAPAPPSASAIAAQLSDRQQRIITHLGVDPLNVDRLVELTDLPAHEVLQDLTFLTLKGLVKRIDGQTFARSGANR